MKTKVLIGIFFIATLFLGIGCKDEVSVQEETIDDFLSDAITSMAKTYQGFDVSITQALWMRQVRGGKDEAYSRYVYSFSTDKTDNLWNEIYINQLRKLDSVITLADVNGGGYYKAVAEILEAEAWATLTDMFGDVPFSEAFGSDNPHYDPQQVVYEGIFTLLDDAIDIINSGEKGNIDLGSGDLIYNWDMDKWLKFAYTLKARYKMRLSKVETIDYNDLLSDLDKAIQSSGDEPRFYFAAYNITPPIEKYISDNNSLLLDLFFFDILDQRKDPRFSVLQYNGFWAQGDAYFPFVQYTETLFLRAEANWHLGDYAQTRQYIEDAVLESLNKYMIADYSDWYTGYCAMVDTIASDTLIYEIALQKYLDLIYTPECYSEWRRLDYPVITPTVDTVTTPPLRYPYSKSDLDNNDNAPVWDGNLTIFDPVWWDK